MTACCTLCKKYAPHWDPVRMCLRPCHVQIYWRRGPANVCRTFVNDDGAQCLLWHANHTLPEGKQYDA